MGLLEQPIKPQGLCKFEGCSNKVKNKRRIFCSRECHEKSIGAKIPKCTNPACNKRVKRGRNQYCSWTCYKVHNNVNAHELCQRQGCKEKLVSRKSTRKYCSQDCYRLDHPNRPSRKKVRLCTLPDCGKQIKRRGNGRKFCSVTCSVKARKKLLPVNCPTCEKQYQPARFRQIYCSDECRKNKKEFTLKNVSGNIRRFAKENKKWKLAANLTWSQTNGDVPKGFNVWFHDNEPLNDLDINNLYIVDHKTYLALCRKKSRNNLEEGFEKNGYTGRTESKSKKFIENKEISVTTE